MLYVLMLCAVIIKSYNILQHEMIKNSKSYIGCKSKMTTTTHTFYQLYMVYIPYYMHTKVCGKRVNDNKFSKGLQNNNKKEFAGKKNKIKISQKKIK